MKYLLSTLILLCTLSASSQTGAPGKAAGLDIKGLDTAYFKGIVAALVQDAEAGFAKTKGKDTIVSGQKVWRANTGIDGALMVRVRAIQERPLYETVLHANSDSDEALAVTIKLAGLVARALGTDYVNQSGANLGAGGKGSAWQERFEPRSGSGKAARIVLGKAEAQGGRHTVTLSILGTP